MKKLLGLLIVVIMIATIALPMNNVALAVPQSQYVYISELPVGSLVVDTSHGWNYRTGTNYTGPDNGGSVVWKIVAKNHTGYPANSVTLLSEYLVASYTFDNSTNRGSTSGSARWDLSGTDNATLGILPWLADVFYEDALSAEFKNKVLTTTVSTDTRYDTDGNWDQANLPRTYTTQDKVFLPSYEELFSSIGSTTLGHFGGDFPNNLRATGFPGGSNEMWWTRAENVYTGGGTTPNFVMVVPATGEVNYNSSASGSQGVRPMLNLANDVLVTAEPNADGYHEIVWDVVAQVTDSDLDGFYFAGDTLSFNIYNLPANENVIVYFQVMNFMVGTFLDAPVLYGLDSAGEKWSLSGTTDERGMLSVSGQVNEDVPFGEVFVQIYDEFSDEIITFVPIETPSEFVYVSLPLVYGDFVFNFDLIDNLWDFTQEVWVTVGDIGRITFNPVLAIDEEYPGVPPIIYAVAMLASDGEREWLSFTWNSEEKQFSIWVDSEALTWLAENGATIEIYDFAARFGVEGMTATNFLDYLEIKVYDNDGELVADISGYLDISAITYDPVEDVLTIPVNHFSEYVFGLKITEPVEPTEPIHTPVTGTNINWFMLPGFLLLAVGLWVVKRYAVGSDA